MPSLHRLAIVAILAISILVGQQQAVAAPPPSTETLPARSGVTPNHHLVPTIAMGIEHTCAYPSWEFFCWGENQLGQLGDGTLVDRAVPVPVLGLSDDTRTVTAGSAFTCALTNAGQVYCWGTNDYGQFGNGQTSYVPKTTPTLTIPGGFRDIDAGYDHMCGVNSIGEVYCWGNNDQGQLGIGTTEWRPIPTRVPDLTNIIQVSAGAAHTCALQNTGQVYCWGWNTYGQVGDGTTTNQWWPTLVPGLSGAQQVSAGGDHTCAMRRPSTSGGFLVAGATWCWGQNDHGQLGNGTRTQYLTPRIVSRLRDPEWISAGRTHTCAVRTDLTAVCWGSNLQGELGDGTFQHQLTPVAVLNLTEVVTISAGFDYSCARGSDGTLATVYCWGDNAGGELGNGTTIDSPTPVPVSW